MPSPSKPAPQDRLSGLDRTTFHLAAPDLWLEETTGEKPWSKQREIMRAVVTHPRVAVASCNGAGKDWLAARIAVWWLAMFEGAEVVTTAPTDRQVNDILWTEIRVAAAKAKARGKEIGGRLLPREARWVIDDEKKWFMVGFATKDNDPEKFKGFHSPHMLVIADEAAGITEKIYEGIGAILTGGHAHFLAIGNPTVLDGWFFDAFTKPGWWTTHIDAFDTPNVKSGRLIHPGMITAEDIQTRRIDYGEGSPLWQANVRGQFPDRLDDTIIPIAHVEAARDKEAEDDPNAEVVVGADFARGGEDSTVFVARRGTHLFAGEEHNQKDAMQAAGLLAQFCRANGATIVHGDAVGVGGGPLDRLREVMPDIQVTDMGAGTRAWEDENYINAGMEWYANLAEMLRDGRAWGNVFGYPRAIRELTARKRRIRSDGRWELEPKQIVKKRGARSPDWGDAIAMCYAPPPRTGAEAMLEYMRRQVADAPAPAEEKKQTLNPQTRQVDLVPTEKPAPKAAEPAQGKPPKPAPRSLKEIYDQAQNKATGAAPMTHCGVCKKPLGTTRVEDGFEAYHPECYARRG